VNGKTAWLSAFLAMASVTLLSCGSGQKARSAGLPTASVYSNLGKVAYELDGYIYVKALPDGESVRLAQGSEPRWSPSGEWLLVLYGGTDWVMRTDGSDRRPVTTGEAVWSPAEDRLAHATASLGQGSSTSLVVESADGSDRREIASIEAALCGLSWSPDGNRLAYNREVQLPPSTDQAEGEAGKVFPISRRASLWVVDVEAPGNPIELYTSTTDGIVVAGWTADSESVLFWRDISFSASAMADGLPLEAIPAQGGRPLALAAGHLALWAPAPFGQRIAMTVPPGRDTWMRKRIAIVDAGTAALQYLTPEDRVSIQPAWSPDGDNIAFVSKPETDDELIGSAGMEALASDRRIWVMNADGSDQYPLTGDAAYRDEHPEWSADGSQVLFARLDGDRLASLWLMSSEGGAPAQVVDRIESSTEGLTGYYTNIGWDAMFDWWQPALEKTSPTLTPWPTSQPQPNPSVYLHPLLSGRQADRGTVITDEGEALS
jgi:Tol biopolymer transport system component